MSLYLCVFAGNEEADGVEVGAYADFNALRHVVARDLEGGVAGSRFPTLMLHSDCAGAWSVADCAKLRLELALLAAELKARLPLPFPSRWQADVAAARGLSPRNAFESFIDVDGEFLLERLRGLAETALGRGCPILFQ
jgi:hypothetical protein